MHDIVNDLEWPLKFIQLLSHQPCSIDAHSSSTIKRHACFSDKFHYLTGRTVRGHVVISRKRYKDAWKTNRKSCSLSQSAAGCVIVDSLATWLTWRLLQIILLYFIQHIGLSTACLQMIGVYNYPRDAMLTQHYIFDFFSFRASLCCRLRLIVIHVGLYICVNLSRT